MSKSVFFAIAGLILMNSSCSSLQKSEPSSLSFEQAEALFDKEFPRSWPPKQINEPFTDEQNKAVIQITNSLSEFLSERKVAYEKMSPTVLTIEPSTESEFNRTAQSLTKNNISIKYDAKYFARNPFSAGTFDEKSKTMILSHRTFKDEKLSKQILAHELVHVETFRNKQNKIPSPFYCQFKGKQFAPHLLSCDEMNAYNSDIKRYLTSAMNPKSLKSKIGAAKMHTDPIPSLIENLDLNSAKKQGKLILVRGKNEKGKYWVEFPVFSVKTKSLSAKQIAKTYLNEVKDTAEKFSKYIHTVEKK